MPEVCLFRLFFLIPLAQDAVTMPSVPPPSSMRLRVGSRVSAALGQIFLQGYDHRPASARIDDDAAVPLSRRPSSLPRRLQVEGYHSTTSSRRRFALVVPISGAPRSIMAVAPRQSRP